VGETPKLRVTDSEEKERSSEFPLRREAAWHAGIANPELSDASEDAASQPTEDERPEDLFGVDHFKHRDQRVLSLIDVPLWSEAGWIGTFFMWPYGTDFPPFLGLMFRNREAARVIFLGLRNERGEQATAR